MKFNKLRLLGFKSFVEPVEFMIDDGLTGVVGPNGCGKSNLVEALRWVMGENSFKNMRASGMDDVIFSGSGNRPPRNTAEVSLFLDNSSRTAPAAFNDADELQVSRRIEREAGSVYRINGKEVRAKDVQLLFADASTGARSPSMVGQGRIGELISAKPQARRALLEEAAGISGLHSRRHEAELRLRAAEGNLDRLEDVLAQMETQLESLKRQARQANRYRTLSADVRRCEALLFHLRWMAAKAAEAESMSAAAQATSIIAAAATAQANAAREQAIASLALPPLREAEAASAAALQRLTIALGQIDEEAARAAARIGELERRGRDLDADIAREKQLQDENGEAVARLRAEEAELEAAGKGHDQAIAAAQQRLDAAAAAAAASEGRFGELTGRVAAESARKTALQRNLKDAEDRGRRLGEELARIETQLTEVVGKLAAFTSAEDIQSRADMLEKRTADAEADTLSAEKAAEAARRREQEMREPVNEARAVLGRIDTETRTLTALLNQAGGLFAPVVERIDVAAGFEAALGAALGDDLEAPLDANAPAYWLLLEGAGDAKLPEGVTPMASVVKAPAELSRRLAQTGIVSRADGPRLQTALKPGQRLVSKEGDLWRWDGFVAGAEAPTAAAQRLAQKNRLTELEAERSDANYGLSRAEGDFESAQTAARNAQEGERRARETWRTAQRELGNVREELVNLQRQMSQFTSRKATLEEGRNRIGVDLQEARASRAEAEAALAAVPDISGLERDLEALRGTLAAERSAAANARAEVETIAREQQGRARRIAAIAAEIEGWNRRGANAAGQIGLLEGRRTETAAELEKQSGLPLEIAARRRALSAEIDTAQARRQAAAAALAEAERVQGEADRRARETLDALAAARESGVRSEERHAAASDRRSEIEARIREELECAPHEAFARTSLDAAAPLPEPGPVERELEKLKAERERLGAVNLRADTEATEITEQRDALIAERDDLVEAIRRLRQGIGSLNREGRERLLEAFGVVNGHFQRLFSTLFGGGTAELQLIESDDPLEAGLEILARPPGKRPQTMTLLSGGEQALTAMALIFAVFLTNPAPICVLDEVDAPLDDHNVERFCNLMDQMTQDTATRFVIITHNPITMARMNRLFGVTMAERGVSQLVSVDLQAAEKMVAA